jgi:Do/DeqQ family serine protease
MYGGYLGDQEDPVKMRHRNVKLLVLAAVVIAVAAPTLLFSYGRAEKSTGAVLAQTPSASPADTQALADATKNLATIQLSFREVVKKVLPVVVEVNVTEQSQSGQATNPFDFFFNQNPGGGGRQLQPRVQQGLGSGIIVQNSGDTYYVLTNNHVVDGATTITVKLQDGTTTKARVVGTDNRKDLAVISFTSKNALSVADLGDSGELQVGDLVLAVGNPFGFENTVTMGIVSALGRSGQGSVASNTDYIQTDASINQGNSGGALVNIKGEVIGINTWIAAPTGGSIGLGFAIPINNAKKAISDFITKGKVEYGWLGVSVQDPTPDTIPGVARDLKVDNVKGSLVVNVYKNSPADKAGMLPGDYVTRVNGQDVQNTSKLIQVVGDLLAGKSYDFELIRAGERQKVSVKLATRPADDSDALSVKTLWPGVIVIHVNDQVRQQAAASGDNSIPQGVDGIMVASLISDSQQGDQSPSAIAGLRIMDVITQINGVPIRSAMDFYKALNDKTKGSLIIKVTRQGTDVTVTLPR